jgi:hypothetical protein
MKTLGTYLKFEDLGASFINAMGINDQGQSALGGCGWAARVAKSPIAIAGVRAEVPPIKYGQ